MTCLELETQWLSVKYWVRWSVLPTSILLLLLLIGLKLWNDQPIIHSHASVILGFFAAYFIFVRGGHLVMIRSMHFDMKRKYGEAYDKHLARLPLNLGRYNLGFTLARIKRDLIHAKTSSQRSNH